MRDCHSPDHVARLTKGVDSWNAWRNENPTRADLSGANLSGANLVEANLTVAYLSGADFNRPNLTGADLSGAYLGGEDPSTAVNSIEKSYVMVSPWRSQIPRRS
jgi:uncharacterized protein YjbI with pentapeptide repeats